MIDHSEPTFLTSNECSDIAIKVAATREELAGAFRLAYQSYLRAGLCNPCAEELRITPYQLLPTTEVIVAELRGEIISTLSLVRDGALGLPLEAVYPDEVRQRRAAGLKLAEVSCLADRRKDIARFFPLFAELARLMMHLAERDAVDQLLIAVHPRHARMYTRAMAFKQVGDDRGYPAVNGNPAVLLCLDLEETKQHAADIWRTFVGEPLPRSIVAPRPIAEVDRRYFAELASRLEAAGAAAREASARHDESAAAPALACA
jgi:hypothetical protein